MIEHAGMESVILAPDALSVSYKNQKYAWMDSEIFRGQVFDTLLHYAIFSAIRPPVGFV